MNQTQKTSQKLAATSKVQFIHTRTRSQTESKSVFLPAKNEKASTKDQRSIGKIIRPQSASINREEVKIIFLYLTHSNRPILYFLFSFSDTENLTKIGVKIG